MNYVINQLRAMRRRFRDFRYRVDNYLHYRDMGMAPGLAWEKAENTFNPPQRHTPWH